MKHKTFKSNIIKKRNIYALKKSFMKSNEMTKQPNLTIKFLFHVSI